jgi:hypothetical protein
MLIRNIFSSSLLKKAAFLIAAFFILQISSNAFAKESIESFEDLKKAAGQLLLKKQKSEALAAINKFLKNENNQKNFAEANEFLIRVSQTFLSKEAQDAYEGSINATLDNPKEAQRLIDSCLSLEPDNSDCIIQKIRLSHREKNRYFLEKYLKELMEIAKTTPTYHWVEESIQKSVPGSGFKDKSFMKNFSGKINEETFILSVLEIERSFAAKNFSRARSGIEFLEKAFPEYPENIYFKQKLDADSSEEKPTAAADGGVIYSTKCKSLTKTMARKFRYDFDLCLRGPQ